jgi:hypothetical protein
MGFYFILSNLKTKKMKTIEAVSIWDNGQTVEATILNAYAVNVTLGTSATFYYQLLSQTTGGNVGQQVAQGNLNMSGEAYQEWDQDEFAWEWVAEQLNLTITGDYAPPVPTTTTSTTTEAPVTTTSTTTEQPLSTTTTTTKA